MCVAKEGGNTAGSSKLGRNVYVVYMHSSKKRYIDTEKDGRIGEKAQ